MTADRWTIQYAWKQLVYMAIAAVQDRDTVLNVRTTLDDRHGWGLALLLTVVATLFLRPADLIPALDNWPIYQFLIVCCLVVSARAVARQLAQRKLGEQTVTTCLLVLLLSVGVSHLSHGFVWGARMSMYEVSKLLAFYLLIAGLVNTPQRLSLFVRWLTIAITTAAVLALLDRAGLISIAALESIQSHGGSGEGQGGLIERIRGTGIFQDPNDFGLILVTGLIFCASFFLRPDRGWPRYLWLGPGIVLSATFAMTHSRGALVSLACALPALLAYRRGWKAGVLTLLWLPLLPILFSDRMTDFSAIDTGTGQSRIQVWSDSLTVFRQYPLFGLGEGLLVEENGVVAHNSFLHCFAELGLFGGTAFLSCFLAAALGLWLLRDECHSPGPPDCIPRELREIAHLRAFVFAALAAYSAGMLTLSRQFVAPTYLILGLAVAAQSLSSPNPVKWQIGKLFLAHRFAGQCGCAAGILSDGSHFRSLVVTNLYVEH